MARPEDEPAGGDEERQGGTRRSRRGMGAGHEQGERDEGGSVFASPWLWIGLAVAAAAVTVSIVFLTADESQPAQPMLPDGFIGPRVETLH